MEAGAPRTGGRGATPRIVVHDVETLVTFLQRVFGVEDVFVDDGRPSQVRIGESVVTISHNSDHPTFPALLDIYVRDVDEVFGRALLEGAEILEDPHDTADGERRALFRDRFGNQYHVAHVPTRDA